MRAGSPTTHLATRPIEMSAPGYLGRGWAARQPETTGGNRNQRIGKPQFNGRFGTKVEVTEPFRTDYGSEGGGGTRRVRRVTSGPAAAKSLRVSKGRLVG